MRYFLNGLCVHRPNLNPYSYTRCGKWLFARVNVVGVKHFHTKTKTIKPSTAAEGYVSTNKKRQRESERELYWCWCLDIGIKQHNNALYYLRTRCDVYVDASFDYTHLLGRLRFPSFLFSSRMYYLPFIRRASDIWIYEIRSTLFSFCFPSFVRLFWSFGLLIQTNTHWCSSCEYIAIWYTAF